MYELRIYFKDLFFNTEKKKALEVFFSSKNSKHLNYVLLFKPEIKKYSGDINIFVVSKNDKEKIKLKNLTPRYLIQYDNFTSLIEKFEKLCKNVEELFQHKFTNQAQYKNFKHKKEKFILMNILLYFSSDEKKQKLLDFIEKNLKDSPEEEKKKLDKQLFEIFEILSIYELDKNILKILLKNIDKMTYGDILRELKRFKNSPKHSDNTQTKSKSFLKKIFSNEKNAIFLPKGFKAFKK